MGYCTSSEGHQNECHSSWMLGSIKSTPHGVSNVVQVCRSARPIQSHHQAQYKQTLFTCTLFNASPNPSTSSSTQSQPCIPILLACSKPGQQRVACQSTALSSLVITRQQQVNAGPVAPMTADVLTNYSNWYCRYTPLLHVLVSVVATPSYMITPQLQSGGQALPCLLIVTGLRGASLV